MNPIVATASFCPACCCTVDSWTLMNGLISFSSPEGQRIWDMRFSQRCFWRSKVFYDVVLCSWLSKCLMFWRITVPTSSESSSTRIGLHSADECNTILQANSYSPNNEASHPRKLNLHPYNLLISDKMTKPFKSGTSLQLSHTWCVDHRRSYRLPQRCVQEQTQNCSNLTHSHSTSHSVPDVNNTLLL